MEGSFADRVRKAAQHMRAKGKTFSSADIAEAIGIQEYREKKCVYNTIYDLIRTGEIARVDKRTFTYRGMRNARPPKQKIMWNYFRMRMKSGSPVTVEELQAAANASKKYVKEWLDFLVRSGFARDSETGNSN